MRIIVDSDGLIGMSHESDEHYKISIKILEMLLKENAELIYPSTTIAETTAVLQIRLKDKRTANKIIEYASSGVLHIEPVDQKTLESASKFLDLRRSNHSTLFDGIVAAVAEKYDADAIFSFDKFYKKRGFKLASDL